MVRAGITGMPLQRGYQDLGVRAKNAQALRFRALGSGVSSRGCMVDQLTTIDLERMSEILKWSLSPVTYSPQL